MLAIVKKTRLHLRAAPCTVGPLLAVAAPAAAVETVMERVWTPWGSIRSLSAALLALATAAVGG